MASNTLTFETISFKNLQSYGNKMTVVDFKRSNNILVSGKNGHGKSTLLSAITFAMFGKPYSKIKKDELVNRANGGELEVTLLFSVNGVKYKVIRGIKPNIFEIYKNDVMINQSSTVRDYQLMLEQSIIGLSELTFRQTVILGSADYTPFMRMTNTDRRTIIEELLDIQMFSVMNQLNKGRNVTLKKDISDHDSTIRLTENSIEHIENHTQSAQDNTDQLLVQNAADLKESQDKEAALLLQIDEATAAIAGYADDSGDKLASNKKKILKLKDQAQDFSLRMKQHTTDKKFFHDNENCPVCSQLITDQLKGEKIDESTEQIEKYGAAIADAKDKAVVLATESSSLQDIVTELSELATVISTAQASLGRNHIEQANIAIRADNIKEATSITEELEKLKGLMNELSDHIDHRIELNKQADLHAAVVDLLKDEGVKSKIIANYIPIFNSLIQKYMSLLEFDISFTVDSQFQDIIKVGRDVVSYMSQSEGQKKRLDLAMLFAMRDLAVVKNSTNTNLLILDEVMDSSLDEEGLESFGTIMQSVTDAGTTVMVISHRAELADKFKGHITISKEGKFSTLIQS